MVINYKTRKLMREAKSRCKNATFVDHGTNCKGSRWGLRFNSKGKK